MPLADTLFYIEFPADRLIDIAGDPNWIDLTLDEAKQLYEALQRRVQPHARLPSAPTDVPTDSAASDTLVLGGA